MTATHTLAARAALGAVAALCTVLLGVSRRRFGTMPSQTFDALTTGLLLASRFGVFLLVFAGLRIQPRGDIPAFYRPEALQAWAGKLPYRDFASSYAPMHPFLDGLVLRLWDSPLALVLFAILVESAVFALFLKLARHGFSEARVRLAALLYLASPISLQFVSIDGQDNILIALFLAAALLLSLRGRTLLAGAMCGMSIVLV